jgi:hypothetical protein
VINAGLAYQARADLVDWPEWRLDGRTIGADSRARRSASRRVGRDEERQMQAHRPGVSEWRHLLLERLAAAQP